MRNVAAATDARSIRTSCMQIMQTDEGLQETPIVAGTRRSRSTIDKVAQLLARALSRDGKATDRLAQVFDTIAPDEERKQRVLAHDAERCSANATSAASSQFNAIWKSMDELLLSYDETPLRLDGLSRLAGRRRRTRRRRSAARDLPPEMPEWVETLRQDNVRALSVLLIIDLLRIETNAARAAEIAADMSGARRGSAAVGRVREVARSWLEELTRGDAERDDRPDGLPRALTTARRHRPRCARRRRCLSDSTRRRSMTSRRAARSFGPIDRPIAPSLRCRAKRKRGDYARARDHHRSASAPPAIPSHRPLADDNRVVRAAQCRGAARHDRAPDAVPPLQGAAAPQRSARAAARRSRRWPASTIPPRRARVQTVLRAATGAARRRCRRRARRRKGSARRPDARPHPRGQRSVRRRPSDRARHAGRRSGSSPTTARCRRSHR